MRRRALPATAALACAALASIAWAGAEDDAFMPKGGRTLLIEALGSDPSVATLRPVLMAQRGDEQWAAFAAERAARASQRERATLAAYLAVNMPAGNAAAKADARSMLAALPRDGRDLAWQQCQFCHSLFSSHLTQSRDAQGWRNMFLSPFHRELKMTPQEREEFARYSALNMPMKVEDVPADLRF
jgi:hypothetical protein